MHRDLLIAEAFATPWALQAERIPVFAAVLGRWQAGRQADPEVLAEIRTDAGARAQRRGAPANVGGVQLLNLFGVITQRGNMMNDVSGPGTISTELFTKALREALADDAVAGIVINIDSPGGSVFGVGELASEIYQARASKPIYAVANSLAASGAYWLAASASQLFVTPGGEVGSIGVFTAHKDLSKALELEGIKVTTISAGKYKAEGDPSQPLAPEAKEAIQSRVDSYYAAMTRSIAQGRGVPVAAVRDGMGQGRIVGASQALGMGMVDGVQTLDQVVAKLGRVLRDGRTPAERVALAGSGSSAAAFSGSDDQARLRQAQRARDLELSGS